MNERHDDTTRRRVPDVDEPLTDAEFERGRAAMLARRAREATGLSQQEFAKRYDIPVATLRDWEQGRRMPDATARNYLRLIVRDPEWVAETLHDAA